MRLKGQLGKNDLRPLKILDPSSKAKLKSEKLNKQGKIYPIPTSLSQAQICTHQDSKIPNSETNKPTDTIWKHICLIINHHSLK